MMKMVSAMLKHVIQVNHAKLETRMVVPNTVTVRCPMQIREVTPELRVVRADRNNAATFVWRGFFITRSIVFDTVCIRPIEVGDWGRSGIPEDMVEFFRGLEWRLDCHHVENQEGGIMTGCLFNRSATLADAVSAIDAYWLDILRERN